MKAMTESPRRRRGWRFKEENSDCEKEEMNMDNQQGKVMVRRRMRTRRRRWRWIIKDRGRLSGTEGNHWRRRDILAQLENGFSGFAS